MASSEREIAFEYICNILCTQHGPASTSAPERWLAKLRFQLKICATGASEVCVLGAERRMLNEMDIHYIIISISEPHSTYMRLFCIVQKLIDSAHVNFSIGFRCTIYKSTLVQNNAFFFKFIFDHIEMFARKILWWTHKYRIENYYQIIRWQITFFVYKDKLNVFIAHTNNKFIYAISI